MRHRQRRSHGGRDRGLAALLALVALAAVIVTGCGSDNSDNGTASTASAKVGPSGLPDLHGTTIRYLGFGGISDETMQKVWFEPFEKATGAKITVDSPTDYKKLQVQQQSGNVTYDLVDGDPFVMDPKCGSAWEKLDLPNLKNVLPAYKPKSECTAPDFVYTYVIAYSPKAFPSNPPQNCQDFFDTKKFPGKRQSWSYYYGDTPECAAVASGADPKNPYPLNIDNVTNKVKSIKGDLSLFDTTQQAADAMANNDAVMGIYTTRMVYQGQQAGADWKVAPGWSSTASGSFGIPKGAPQSDGAKALLNYILDPANNKRFFEALPVYGSPEGVKPASATKLDPTLVSGSDVLTNVGSTVDWTWWAQNDPEFSEKWVAATTG